MKSIVGESLEMSFKCSVGYIICGGIAKHGRPTTTATTGKTKTCEISTDYSKKFKESIQFSTNSYRYLTLKRPLRSPAVVFGHSVHLLKIK